VPVQVQQEEDRWCDRYFLYLKLFFYDVLLIFFTAGAAAGIAIGGAAAIGLIGFGGKKGYPIYVVSFPPRSI
jgi:hypothetical protein